jgi:hypothetical protein
MLYSILHRLSKQLLLAFILVLPFSVNAAISDIQFGQYQIADSQWNVNACLNTTTCQIYSKQPGTAYKIPWYNGQVQWAAGDYVKLELSGDPNYPYVARQYSSTGVLKETLGTGKIVNMGPDYFFFVGNDNNTGQLFSGSSGMADTSGVTWTGTLNPTIQQADAYADAGYSTTPLAAGQTAAPPPPSYGVNFTRVTSFEWKNYTAGSQPVGGEQAHEAFDNSNSKWFGYLSQGAWVVVQFVDNSQQYSATRAVQKIQFRTANDFANRDPTGYRIWGSADGVNWVLIKEEAIALPSGRNTDSQVYELNNVTAYAYYKVEFTGVKDGGNAFQINEIKLIYDVDDPQGTQAGGGIYVQPTPVYGPSGASINQQTLRSNALNENAYGHNAVVGITGDDNIVTIQQIGSGGHYASVDIQGNVNTVSVNQTGANGSRHYLDTAVIGNNNSLTLTQSGASKTQFVLVNGANNTLTTTQQGAGSHFLNLGVSGDNHTVGIVQDGAGNHSANVVLDGSQPWNFQLNQNSSTNQNYTLPHGMSDGSTVSGSCAAIGGCNLIVNQQ